MKIKRLFFIFMLISLPFFFHFKEKKLTFIPTTILNHSNDEISFTLADWQVINSDVVFLLEFKKDNALYTIPVVYKENDANFYFRKALDLSYDSMGTAFIDQYSSLDSLNLIINAHSSKEKDIQFTFLKNYADEAYFNQNSSFKLIGRNAAYLCDVYSFAEYDLTLQDVDLVFYAKPKNKKDLLNMLAFTQPYQIHQNPISSDFERIITLVTCNMDKENSRYVLQATIKEEKNNEENHFN